MAQRVQTRSERTGVPEIATVLLSVPAHKDYIVIVRSAVAQLGGCFGFTLGEIGDLRLAVDEACNLLVSGRPGSRAAGGATLQCRAEVRDGVLRVTVAGSAADSSEPPPDTDGLGWTLLTALVDSLTWDHDGDTVRVELEKHRGAREG